MWSCTFVLIPERVGCKCTTHSGLPISQLLLSFPPMMDLLGLAVPLSQCRHLKWQLDASQAAQLSEDKSMCCKGETFKLCNHSTKQEELAKLIHCWMLSVTIFRGKSGVLLSKWHQVMGMSCAGIASPTTRYVTWCHPGFVSAASMNIIYFTKRICFLCLLLSVPL